MSDKLKKKEDGELSGEEEEYKSPKQKKSDKDDRKKSKRSSRSHSSRRTNDKVSDSTKSSKKDKDHKDSSRRRSKSRSKDRKDQQKRKHSRSRSRSYQNDRNGTNSKKDKERDSTKDKDRKRSKSPTKDKDRKNDRKRSKSPRSSNTGKRRSSRSKSPKREDSRRDKDSKSNYRESDKRSNYSSNRDKESRKSEENNTRETKQLTLEEEEERNDRYYNEFDDSDSEYYQRANDRKYKSSRRSRSKSKNKDRKRSKSKGRKDDKNDKNKDKEKEKEKSKNSGNGDSSKTSKDKKEEDAKKIQQTQQKQQEEDDDDLNMELEDSDDERERKKQEFLNMIKKQGKEMQKQEATKEDSQMKQIDSKNNQVVSDDKQKTKDQENLENINFADEMSDEQLYDNTGLNPNDVLDDDDVNIANAINDDYKEEIDESHSLTHRHSIDKAQLDHLKYLEDMRNQEIKGGIPDLPDQPVIKQKRKSTNSENVEHKLSNANEEQLEEENKLHKLDDQEDSEEETDMFGDDIDKIINKSNDGKIQVVKGANAECDDEQNYLKLLVGEVLHGKYKVVQKCGKGVFANVYKAEQLDNGKMVAIKILRSIEIMRDSGEREKEIIQKLNLTDKNDRKHIVRLKNVFDYQKHICLVFECFAMNLRDALKEFGKGKGFSLDVVRSYAYQIFVALTHLKKNNYIHADLKPDNLLISEDTKTLKMCDFGTALPIEENGIIKYLQSRFYRAPEVLIGYPPYNQIDVWSIGVTLYEIYTQKILFDGLTNNEMLKLIMDSRGKFNKKMLQNGKFVEEYFDQNYNFKYSSIDKQTNQKFTTIIPYGDIPKKDIYKLLQENKDGISLENQKKLSQFKDFLDKCLQLDPKNRITPEEALEHPFLKLNTTANNTQKPK